MAAFISIFIVGSSEAARVKEIGSFEGIRGNHLIGYGLVVGLEGKGDKSSTEFTVQSLANMLNRFGVKVNADEMSVKNVAGVVVTANITPLDKAGSRIDVMVSSIGDAKTLQGGTLLFTPLTGADGEIYAVAQGPVSIGGFLGGGDGDKVQVNFQTVGRVAGGALVEKEVRLAYGKEIFLALKTADFTTAKKTADAINARFGSRVAQASDATRIDMAVPDEFKSSLVDFLSAVEQINVPFESVSKVVVNERTGTVVIGENVRISTVAVAHGTLTVEVGTTFKVSQPPPFSKGQTVVVEEKDVTIKEQEARLMPVNETISLGDVVTGLNALGVTPRDLIAILQAIKAAGALQAELELI
jgi:flagellar P-ring protein precursor FlgI